MSLSLEQVSSSFFLKKKTKGLLVAMYLQVNTRGRAAEV